MENYKQKLDQLKWLAPNDENPAHGGTLATLYVGEDDRKQITRRNPRTLEELPSGATEITQPRGMCIGPDNLLYAVEGTGDQNASIKKFDRETGKLLGVFCKVDHAFGIAAGPDNAVYVTQILADGNRRIQRYTWDGVLHGWAGLPLQAWMSQISQGPDGNLYCLDGEAMGDVPAGGTLWRICPGQCLAATALIHTPAPIMNEQHGLHTLAALEPFRGIAFRANDGTVYLGNRNTHHVERWGLANSRSEPFARTEDGKAPMEFKDIFDIVFCDEYMFVTDSALNKVYRFDAKTGIANGSFEARNPTSLFAH